MAKDNGGPAFPAMEQWSEWSELKADYIQKSGPMGGMTLRDYFAAKAMQGMIANSGEHFDGQGDTQKYSRLAYEYADAMLQERSK